ncbi:MAG: hypothetical protein IJ837_02240 [Clostridia bacterium]|nr:hypothetical protein [Clostridia bacterium]
MEKTQKSSCEKNIIKQDDSKKASDLFDKKLLIKAVVSTALIDAGVGIVVGEDPLLMGAIGAASSVLAYGAIKTYLKTEEKSSNTNKKEKELQF